MLLTATSIRKTFVGVTALDDVDFGLKAGEIHALMGENGAGKSTLVKVLTGVHPPDSGQVVLDGKELSLTSPSDAVAKGISTVYQEVNLVPNLSVAENICLGREDRGPLGINWKSAKERAIKALDRLGCKIDVNASLGRCSVAEQQLVAIARALDVSCQVLVLDEPTSSLDQHEVAQLFEILRKLRAEGMGIIFITHFLEQVFEVSDRITILRNGKLVSVHDTATITRLELVSAMIGKPAIELSERPRATGGVGTGEALIKVDALTRPRAIEGLTTSVSPGEVVGLAGLLGSGRTESLRLLFGVDRWTTGSFSLRGRSVARHSIARAIRAHIGFCTEDRKVSGIFPDLSVLENLVIVAQAKKGWLWKINRATTRKLVDEYVGRLNIVTSSSDKPIQFLSGGNQQKVLLARWLAASPNLLLLDEPTRGIDVGARYEIEELIESYRQSGMGFCIVSSELDEIIRTSTKVVVLRDRKMVKELSGDEVTMDSLTEAIAGDSPS